MKRQKYEYMACDGNPDEYGYNTIRLSMQTAQNDAHNLRRVNGCDVWRRPRDSSETWEQCGHIKGIRS